MSSESIRPVRLVSNRARRKLAPRLAVPWEERISFRDLARMAARRKTREFLAERCGVDISTAKRWLSGRSRAPASALRAVVVDILARAEL